MRPCITRLERQTLAEPALQRETQGVIRTGSDITLVVDRAKRIGIVRIGIVLVERPDAIAVDRIEGDRTGAQVYGAARKQAHAPTSNVLCRRQEIRSEEHTSELQ